MKTLPSKLFTNCSFSADKDAGFYDTIPLGYDHPVSLYLGEETVKNDEAIERAAIFFDRIAEWDNFCREAFISVKEDSEDVEMIGEYFSFYQDEVPEVFGVDNVSLLSLPDMVKKLTLKQMATHGIGTEQYFTIDFTLGYDQLLCAYFDCNSNLDHLAWES